MVVSNPTHFGPGNGVAREDWSLQLERFNDSEYILTETICRIIRGFVSRSAKATSRYRVDMTMCQ